jgi:hypothetical protein
VTHGAEINDNSYESQSDFHWEKQVEKLFWGVGPFYIFFRMKISLVFLRGIIYFCTMDGLFIILEKTSFQLGLIPTNMHMTNSINRIVLLSYWNVGHSYILKTQNPFTL